MNQKMTQQARDTEQELKDLFHKLDATPTGACGHSENLHKMGAQMAGALRENGLEFTHGNLAALCAGLDLAGVAFMVPLQDSVDDESLDKARGASIVEYINALRGGAYCVRDSEESCETHGTN